LDHDDVFLLDSGWEVSIWVGKAAMGAVDRYARSNQELWNCPWFVTGISACTNQEHLLNCGGYCGRNWCRDSIAPQHQHHIGKHHYASVLASTVSILANYY
jgi:hypothetical protein